MDGHFPIVLRQTVSRDHNHYLAVVELVNALDSQLSDGRRDGHGRPYYSEGCR
jgi:hypothetical protein